jgi:hypothetical protein
MATQNEKILTGILIATIIVAVVVVALTMNRPISNVGKIRAIGFDVFADRECTVVLTQIDWGSLAPGEMGAVTLYARNSGNVNITLSFNTTDWNPPNAANYLTIAWNYSGVVLHTGDVLPIQLTNAVSPSITGIMNYSFTINMLATEVQS